MKSPARFVLHEHRTRPATAGEVEEYLCALLGRDLWAQRAVIPSRLTIAGELGSKNLVLDCYRDDLKEIKMKAPLSNHPDQDVDVSGHPDEEIIVRGGFPLMLADWLLVVCDPMRDLLDQRLETAFPSLDLFRLYLRLRNLDTFLKTIESQDKNASELVQIAESLSAAMEGVPPYIPFSRLGDATRQLGYSGGQPVEDPVAWACINAEYHGPKCIRKQPHLLFPSKGPVESPHRKVAWIVTNCTLVNWSGRCPWDLADLRVVK